VWGQVSGVGWREWVIWGGATLGRGKGKGGG